MEWNPLSSEADQELHQVAEEVKNELELEKEEVQLDEEILQDLNQVIEDYEDIADQVQQLQDLPDNPSPHDVLMATSNSSFDYARVINEVEDLKQRFSEIIEDLRRKHKDLESQEKLDAKVEEQIEMLNDQYLQNLVQTMEKVEALKENQ